MRLEMRAIDRDGPGGGAFGGQGLEDTVENTGLAPVHETVVERLVRTVAGGRVTPHQPIADDMDDAADDFSVIDPWDAAHLVGQQGLQAGKLRVG